MPTYTMKCSICNRISGTGRDHIDCIQKRRIEMEDENFKQEIPERLNLSKNSELATGIKAILDHMTKKNKQDSDSP